MLMPTVSTFAANKPSFTTAQDLLLMVGELQIMAEKATLGFDE